MQRRSAITASGDYKVDPSGKNLRNEVPEVNEDQALTELKAEARAQSSLGRPYEIDGRPNPAFLPREVIMQNAKIDFTEPEICPFCKKGQVVFRKSDTKFDRVNGKKISIVEATGGWPIWIPIDSTSSGKNYFGNYGDDLGNVKTHICSVETMGEDDLRAFVKHNYEKQVEFEKWVREQLKDIRETAMFKPMVLKYREEY